MIPRKELERKASRDWIACSPGIVLSIDALTIAENPGVALVNEMSSASNISLNAGTVDGVI